jgi:TRAP-type mannitol/chloroaromatic compound transport system permease small subunit
MARFFLRFADYIERFSELTGRLISWLVLAMALIIGYDVAMRYLFQSGSVALQELEWHLFALVFLFGAAYTLKHDDHVRVDIFYRSRCMGPRRRAAVDLLGSLLFLIPFCLLVISGSLPFVENAYAMAESSPDPGGLPARWLLKAAIPLGFSLLLLQGLALAIRSSAVLLCPECHAVDEGDTPPQQRHDEKDHLL